LRLSWGYTSRAGIGVRRSYDGRVLNSYLRYGFIENLDTVRHILLGKFWNIEVSITPITWLSPIVFFGLGLLLNLPGLINNRVDTLYHVGVFVLGVEISTLIHAFGHILGGKLVCSPMDELLLTATRGVNIYHGDQSRLPSFVHVGRASGGPILNLLIYAVMSQLLSHSGVGFRADVLAAIASTSLFIGAGGFLPLPSVDGQVIWREVFLWHHRITRSAGKNTAK